MTHLSEAKQKNKKQAKVFLIESKNHCDRCERLSAVVAISAYLGAASQEEESGLLVFCWVTKLSKILSSYVQGRYEHHYSDEIPGEHPPYYMNHCEHCGSQFNDFYLHQEHDGAFCPFEKHEAASMKLIESPFYLSYDIDSVRGLPRFGCLKSGGYGFDELIWEHSSRAKAEISHELKSESRKQ